MWIVIFHLLKRKKMVKCDDLVFDIVPNEYYYLATYQKRFRQDCHLPKII